MRTLLPPFLFVKQLHGQVKVGDDFPATLLDSRLQDAVLEFLGSLVTDTKGSLNANHSVDVVLALLFEGVGLRFGRLRRVLGEAFLDVLFQILEEFSL